MEPRFPSGSSALPVRRSEIRRRSGQGVLSPNSEDERASSLSLTHSPSFRGTRHLKPVPDLLKDDPYHDWNKIDALTQLPERSKPGLAVELVEAGAPSVLLVRPKGLEGTHTGYSGVSTAEMRFRVDAPLPSLPEEASWENNYGTGETEPFSSVPLTPRPEAPSRFPSQDSHASKASQRSVFSLFPRLPTPDFTALKRNPLHQSIITPLNFIRARTPSLSSASAASSLKASARTSSIKRTETAGSIRSFTTGPVHTESFRRDVPRMESFNSTQSDSSTLCDEEMYALFMKTAPSRFTRKFPSPASMSAFGRSLPYPGALETLAASESGDDLGIERMGRWTGYKWCLLLSVLTVLGYALTGLVCAILTWFGARSHADVMWVADNDILIFITFASTLLLLTGLVGLTGTLLNSRSILAFYALLLWPSFVSVLVVGYTSYKREAFSLDKKLNMAWSQWYDALGRLLIQESLHCCGFYNPLHEATFSKNCYPRTPLPGCKGKLFRFERENLRLCWRLAFSLVPPHILNIAISLLCSNHVDRRFGKGLTPRAYRLSMADVRANADVVLAQFTDTKPPLEPSRSFSHVTDREDRPVVPRARTPYEQGYADIGQSFLSG